MKIGLNATCINNRPSGARQRFVGIYSNLFKLMPNDQFIIYEPNDCNLNHYFEKKDNLSFVKTLIPSEGRAFKYFRSFEYWNFLFRNDYFDIFEAFHIPYFKVASGKAYLTIHDIRSLLPHSKLYEKLFYNKFLSDAINKVDSIITVSESMKYEILEYFPHASVQVIYNGIDVSNAPSSNTYATNDFYNKYNINGKFILSVGHIELRKNYFKLIQAYSILVSKGIEENLLIIGNDSGERKSLDQLVSFLKLDNRVIFLNGINDDEIKLAYKACTLFVFPSLYEGFGIPILEAMNSNCPLVVSDLPVFIELTEGKGVYFDPHDHYNIADAIESVLSSEIKRIKLINYGKKRVLDFSFEKISLQLLNIYKN